MNKQNLVLAFLVMSVTLFSCGPKKFTKLKSGLEYMIVKKGEGKKKAIEGSIIKMNITTKVGDTVVFDSYKMNHGDPVQAQVSKPASNGDIMEGLPFLVEGDSAIFKISADSLFKGGQPKPPFVKKGDMVTFTVKMVKVQTMDEFKKEQEDHSQKQVGIDDKLIQDYIAKNNIQAQKTASGIYYVIEKAGNGIHPVASDKVKVNYKGTLMDGTVFDSSYDKGQPIEFPLSGVIKGWTEGIPLFEVGGKGKLIVPSTLAYGENPQPGSPIKPNSILIFDIELLAITTK